MKLFCSDCLMRVKLRRGGIRIFTMTIRTVQELVVLLTIKKIVNKAFERKVDVQHCTFGGYIFGIGFLKITK